MPPFAQYHRYGCLPLGAEVLLVVAATGLGNLTEFFDIVCRLTISSTYVFETDDNIVPALYTRHTLPTAYVEPEQFATGTPK